MKTLKPLNANVLIRRDPEVTMSSGGIIIPDTLTEKPMEGEVLAVGTGRLLDNGFTHPPTVKPGDRVMFGKFAGVEIVNNADDGMLLLMDEKSILGLIDA